MMSFGQRYSNTPRSRGYGELAAVIVLFIIVPLFIYLFKTIKNKLLLISETRKLKEQLTNIDRQISSFKEIDATGDISNDEKKEWLDLTQKHKKINDKIVSIRNQETKAKTEYDADYMGKWFRRKGANYPKISQTVEETALFRFVRLVKNIIIIGFAIFLFVGTMVFLLNLDEFF
tara:strand:- start:350 stop:874 length:525 start_codon:yes stop_codon:yes gene_type:complete